MASPLNSSNHLQTVWDKLLSQQQQQIAAMMQTGGGSAAGGPLSAGMSGLGAIAQAVYSETPKPSLDISVLEKLKASEPRKVLAKMPDRIEPITAWRAWKVSGTKLHALGMSGCWEPKKIMSASCQKGGSYDPCIGYYTLIQHESPQRDCSCGIWAFKTLDNLVSAVQGSYQTRVLGQVSLWGRVIETENGYRAQFGYPKELWLFDNSLEELGYIYGVPVRTV
jgi:hypothetical protein